MKTKLYKIFSVNLFALLIVISCGNTFAQGKIVLYIRGNVHIYMNGGTVPDPVYLVVNVDSNQAIYVNGTGGIISEGDGNFVKWNAGASYGLHVIPFKARHPWGYWERIPFTFRVDSLDSLDKRADFWVSTYGTPTPNNLPWSFGVSDTGSVWGGSMTGTVIDRWWRIYAYNAAVKAEMTFSYIVWENFTTANPGDATLAQQWDEGIGEWLYPIGPGDPGELDTFVSYGYARSDPTNNFPAGAPWILVRQDNPLPIKLVHFSANCNGDKPLLEWTTASEVNNDYFTIQRSSGGEYFENIGLIAGAGNSNQLLQYYFTDNSPLEGDAYYRLKQTDYNGTSTYSQLVYLASCSGQSQGGGNVYVYFEPGSESLTVVLGEYSGNATVVLRDLLGKQLSQRQPNDFGMVKMEIGHLAFGIYLIEVQTATKTTVKKIYVSR